MITTTLRVFCCHAEMTEALARPGFLYLFLCFKSSRAEEQISELEHRMVEITAEEQNKEKRMNSNEDHLRDLWDNINHTSVWIIGVPEEHRRRQWHSTPVLLPGKSHGRRSLVGCSPWGHEESNTTERLDFHFSLSCIGGGNGNPLQRSCLENPRDGGFRLWGCTESDTTEATWQQQQQQQQQNMRERKGLGEY